MITASGLAVYNPERPSAYDRVHESCDETIRLLQDDLRKYNEYVAEARAALGEFAALGRPLADCVRDLRERHAAEVRELRRELLACEDDRDDDWARSELKGDQE